MAQALIAAFLRTLLGSERGSDSYAVDFSSESDALTPDNVISWEKKRCSHSDIAWSDP